ncbi:hypothetical protein NECAME_02920 [Necator americanus]|uniref:Uncharacterized protein n=1 Tax=Necator americanus TaxID=51031 RepID=W2T9D9_NECAM|nr:hypothetical protein NECAME_02920 [Necator americanus]ETN78483.1 hypothetical protein NECAME_02920 [Necator americanus]
MVPAHKGFETFHAFPSLCCKPKFADTPQQTACWSAADWLGGTTHQVSAIQPIAARLAVNPNVYSKIYERKEHGKNKRKWASCMSECCNLLWSPLGSSSARARATVARPQIRSLGQQKMTPMDLTALSESINEIRQMVTSSQFFVCDETKNVLVCITEFLVHYT